MNPTAGPWRSIGARNVDTGISDTRTDLGPQLLLRCDSIWHRRKWITLSWVSASPASCSGRTWVTTRFGTSCGWASTPKPSSWVR